MNTGSQRKFLSCYTLWLLPAIAGAVLVIVGLVMMTIFVLDSYLTLWRALSILGSLAAGCSLIALSVMRLHKHRRATYAPDQEISHRPPVHLPTR